MMFQNIGIILVTLLSMLGNSANTGPGKSSALKPESSDKLSIEDQVKSLPAIDDAYYAIWIGSKHVGYGHSTIHEVQMPGAPKIFVFSYEQHTLSTPEFAYPEFKYVTQTDQDLHFLKIDFRGYDLEGQIDFKIFFDPKTDSLVKVSSEGEFSTSWVKDVEVFQEQMLGIFMHIRKAKANSVFQMSRFFDDPYAQKEAKLTVKKVTTKVIESTLATFQNDVLVEIAYDYTFSPTAPNYPVLRGMVTPTYTLERADKDDAMKTFSKGFDRNYRRDPFKGTLIMEVIKKEGPSTVAGTDVVKDGIPEQPKSTPEDLVRFASDSIEAIAKAGDDAAVISKHYEKLLGYRAQAGQLYPLNSELQRQLDEFIKRAALKVKEFDQLKTRILASCALVQSLVKTDKINEASTQFTALSTLMDKLQQYANEYPKDIEKLKKEFGKARKELGRFKARKDIANEKIGISGTIYIQDPVASEFTMSINLFGVYAPVKTAYKLYKSKSRAFINVAGGPYNSYSEGQPLKEKPSITVKRIFVDRVVFIYQDVEVELEWMSKK